MKVGILAGGLGSRLSEETEVKPKPMVEIGGKPILWHIMKHFAHYGLNNFVIALGYRGEYIKKFMVDYASLAGNLTVDLSNGDVSAEGRRAEDWTVELIDTGYGTATGGRIKRVAPYLINGNGEPGQNGTFIVAWGDGVSNIDLHKLLAFHRSHGRLATITAVRPPARFGRLQLEGNTVSRYAEKPQLEEGWINGGYFVLEPGVIDYVAGDDTQWERQPLERLAEDGQLIAYKHDSFWQCMDTLRDKKLLESLWDRGDPEWKIWS